MLGMRRDVFHGRNAYTLEFSHNISVWGSSHAVLKHVDFPQSKGSMGWKSHPEKKTQEVLYLKVW